MAKLIRGALMEYGSDFLGPIPNLVIFQFNPETLSRTIQIPERKLDIKCRETHQAGENPVEQISFTAHFNASDQLGNDEVLARMFGIGPRLAALEKMIYPAGKISGLIGEALDAIGDAIFGGGDEDASQPVPRQQYPRILFFWGPTRILPVVIQSMSINEQLYDFILNPIKAEISLTLGVVSPDPNCDDWVAKAAYEYSSLVKDAQAIANLANTVSDIIEIIPF